ncbi:DUF4012 domain-containing protein [Patescibacteria group bacterium]|nr:DUF4012 domain-containing protein [Patescibacteria group bacterium]
MNESKIIKIVAILSVLLIAIGGVLIWQQGQLNKLFSSDKISQLSFWKLVPELIGFNGEKNYLLLFQNNLELRPSGGYIGTFGILKMKNAQIKSFEVHDTNMFDHFGTVQTNPPQPIKDYLKVTNWQMRDGNWSPDFPTAAQQVEYFYHLQGGQEEFDGIIGVNAIVLEDLLKLIGSVYLSEFDKQFNSEDVLYQVEYEVEQGYTQRGIDYGQRKTVFKALIKEILSKVTERDIQDQVELKDLLLEELNKKNIIVFLKNIENQEVIANLSWNGAVDKFYNYDYLMINEANLSARKSNAFIKRSVDYQIDLTKERPEVTLKIEYDHQGKQIDWFSTDYQAYLRVYVPHGSTSDQMESFDELGKTVFGNLIKVPTGQKMVIEFKYSLPEKIKQDERYNILVQKQIGVESLPFKLILKDINQKTYIKEEIIENDWEGIISF